MTMRISILDSSRIDKSGAMAGKKSPLLSSSFKEEWLGRYRTWLKGGGGGGILSPVSTSRHFFLCCICAWKETFRVAYVRSLLDNVVSFGTTPPSCMPSHYLTYYQKKSDNSFILFFIFILFLRAYKIDRRGDDCFLIVNGGLIACTVLREKSECTWIGERSSSSRWLFSLF